MMDAVVFLCHMTVRAARGDSNFMNHGITYVWLFVWYGEAMTEITSDIILQLVLASQQILLLTFR